MLKFVFALTALCLFSTTSFALPNFNPELVVKNSFGEQSQLTPIAGTNFVAAFKSTTVTLTAAQVIALPGTPIQLIAAQSGKLIKIEAIEMKYVKGASAFTIGASKSLIVRYKTANVNISLVSTTGFIDQASSKTAFGLPGAVSGVTVGGTAIEITSDDTTPVSGGTGSTVAVTVFYNVLNVL